MRVQHVEPAHTDGDSMIHFVKADVLHMGDCYFNGMYPFIDVSTGGSIDGMIRAADRALKIVTDKTKIIPGHGPLSGVAELRAFRDMLITARDEIIAAKPTADLDAQWGNGFMKPDVWVGIVYDGMKREQ
jgi:glyoxylase-like metal-dependent hydrolase (beta-lactamase superfamily II)